MRRNSVILTCVSQTGYSLYRPAATVIANTLAGLPFSIVRITVYNIILYFMTGLHRSAGAFFTFELIVCSLNGSGILLLAYYECRFCSVS